LDFLFYFGGIIVSMAENNWVAAIEESKLKENSVSLVFPRGLSILLIRKSGNEIYALSNKCAHMACPLRNGVLDGYMLECPCHDWRFDIRTGKLLEAQEIKIPVYEWKINNGRIWIKI
jgi:nitrite reductase/ring-hydroxylating ferredoxin subunit